MAPIVQLTEQSQGVFITEGFPQGIQIIDGSIPVVQGSDGMSIIQIATPQMVSGSNVEGLTQVGYTFANTSSWLFRGIFRFFLSKSTALI